MLDGSYAEVAGGGATMGLAATVASTDRSSENTSKEIKRKRRKKPHGKIGFEEMAKEIGARWKDIDPEMLAEYKKRAEEDKKRYKEELAAFMASQRKDVEDAREKLEATVSEETRKEYFDSGGKQSAKKKAKKAKRQA